MKLQKVYNAKRNLFTGLINKIITILLPFVLRSVIIYYLGANYLGLNNLFTSILQVLNLTELGFSNAIVYCMYKPLAHNDNDAICALLSFFKKSYRIIGSIVFILGLIVLPFLKYFISADIPVKTNIYVVYILFLVNTCLSYFLSAYKSSILNAYQRFDIISIINTVTLSLMYIVQIGMVVFFKNYYLSIVAMPIFTSLQNIIVAIVTDKMYPNLQCRGNISEIVLKDFKKKVSGLMITKVCNVSRSAFNGIFVSAFIGLTANAIYGNYYYVMNAVISVLTIFGNSILAGVGNSIVIDSEEKNYKDMRKINFLYMWIVGWCTSCLICLYQPFMNLWVGKELTFPFTTVILFGVYFYCLEIGVVRSVYSDGAGLWWQNRYRAIAEAVANLFLTFVFVIFWGVNGIIVATLITIILINFVYGSQIIFKYYFIQESCKEYFLDHLKYAASTFVAVVFSYIICSLISFNGFYGLTVKFFVCTFVSNVILLFIYSHFSLYDISVSWLRKSVFSR